MFPFSLAVILDGRTPMKTVNRVRSLPGRDQKITKCQERIHQLSLMEHLKESGMSSRRIPMMTLQIINRGEEGVGKTLRLLLGSTSGMRS